MLKATVEPAPIYPVKFEKIYDLDENGQIKKESVWCTWMKKGVGIQMSTTDKVERLKRNAAVWAAIEPHYEAWLAGSDEAVIDGTPLAAWSGIEPHQRDYLKKHRIVTLEDFARLTDGDVGKIGYPGVRDQRDRARKFLEQRDNADQVSALQKRIAELEAERATEDPPKRGPGRPRKEQAEASEGTE